MGKRNVADGNDWVAVQVGKIVVSSSSKPAKPKADPKASGGSGTVRNIRAGNARVGRQVDVIIGDLRL